MIDGTAGVNTWASNYGFPFPILDDESYGGSGAIGIGDYIPHHVLIGRDMTILTANQPSDSEIQAALDEEWPEVEYPVPPDLSDPGDDDDDEVPDEGADDDMGVGSSSSNPFLDSSRGSWNGQVVCAVGSTSTAPWIAAALIIPALVWRRRR